MLNKISFISYIYKKAPGVLFSHLNLFFKYYQFSIFQVGFGPLPLG